MSARLRRSGTLLAGSLRAPRGAGRLALWGALTLIPVAYFVLRYPLPGRILLSDLGYLSGFGAREFWLYLGGFAALYALYALALRETRRLPPERALPHVFGWGAASLALAAFMYPATATDVFMYAVRSRLFTTYRVDPIAVYAERYAWDPIVYRFGVGGWGAHPSPYGPLWNLIAAPVTYLAGEDMGLAVGGFKALSVVCLLGSGWAVARALRAIRPEDAATGALLLLWNPLVVWEVAGNGHNDAVMLLPLALGFLAWARGRLAWVLPLLGAAALVKPVAALLLPLAVVAVWRRAGGARARWGLGWRTGALSAVVLAVSFYPFYDLPAVLASVRDTSGIFLVSPATIVLHSLGPIYPAEDLRGWLKLAGWAILGLAFAAGALAVWRRPERLPRASFELLYVFLIIVTTYFQGWYLVWPLALAALLPWGWPAWRMIAWTAGAMATYALFLWVRRWWVPDGAALLRLAIPVLSGPTALLTLMEIARHLRSRRLAPRLSSDAPALGASPPGTPQPG